MAIKDDWVNGQTVDAAALNAVADAVNANTAAIAAGAGTVGAVIVTTCAEARPTGPIVVLWVDPRDEASRPDNMGDNDLWFANNVGEAPTVPTGLTATDIQTNEITVDWDASTDDIAVTVYQVRLDGGMPVNVTSGLTHTFTGLTPETVYSIDVRAGDTGGLFSAYCTAITPETDAASAYPNPLAYFDFHEGSGGAIDEFHGYAATTLGTSGTDITLWAMSIDLTIPSLPVSEKSFLFHNASAPWFWNILTADGKLKLYPPSGAQLVSTTALSTGSVHSIAVVGASGGIRLFLDGTLEASDSTPRVLGTNGHTYVLPDSGNVAGLVDNLRIWNVALSDADVAAVAAA